MTTIHIQYIGEKVLVPQRELERLVELAQQYEEITVRGQEDEMCQCGILCAWWNKVAHLASGKRKGKTFTPPMTGSRCDAPNAFSR